MKPIIDDDNVSACDICGEFDCDETCLDDEEES